MTPKMTVPAPARILIVAGLCLSALVGLVIREGAARADGVEVRLPMEAIDPRSLLSGHYVIVTIQERLAAGASCPPGASAAWDPERRWVAIAREEAAAGSGLALPRGRVLGVATTRAAAEALLGARDGVRVGGVVAGGVSCDAEAPADDVGRAMRVELGVDRFHASQTEALRIEAVLSDRAVGGDGAQVWAVVSLGRDGRARLRGLEVEGERIDLSWL
ncbi:hypothetical protein GC169_03515 [bacterium]|nr:hypothetical protein [bacterium]